jgi:TatA/E family protein of Tat protein translocase
VNFLGMGPLELIVIFGLALVVFGPGKLPEIARQVGKTIGDFRRITAEVSGDLQRSLMTEDQHARPSARPPTAAPTPVGTPAATETPAATPAPTPAAAPNPPLTRRSATDDDALRPPY